MRKKKEIDPTYYDNHDFGEQLYEAERNGTLMVTLPGETAVEALVRYRDIQKIAPAEEPRLLRKVG